MLVNNLEKKPPHRVPGTAVFLTSDPDMRADGAAAQSQAQQGAAREERHPDRRDRRYAARAPTRTASGSTPVSDHFCRVMMTFGYMETPNIPKALALARKLGWKFDIMSTSFFLVAALDQASPQSGMPLWQDKLFIALARNATDATDFFHIPTGRVVEIGTQVTV